MKKPSTRPILQKVQGNFFSELTDSPLMSISNLLTVVGTIGAAIFYVFDLAAPSGSSVFRNISGSGIGSAPHWSPHFQVILLLIFVSCSGWSMGLMIAALARQPSHYRVIFSHIGVFIFAALTTGLVTWLSSAAKSGMWTRDFYMILALAIALMLSRTFFQVTPSKTPNEARARAGALLTFAIAVAVLSAFEWFVGR